MFETVDYLDSVDSTNDYLKKFVDAGQERIVVAREQSAGKGRYGKAWLSPAGQGLYVSYLFYPGLSVQDTQLLNILFSLAVVETIREFDPQSSVSVAVKGPNDVMVDSKKACGILVEVGSEGDNISWAIVGVGVNLYQVGFPDELAERATSLKLRGVEVEHPMDFCEVLTRKIILFLPLLAKDRRETLLRKYESDLV